MNLFAFGSNGCGQLGLGHEEDVSTPTKCQFTPPTNEQDQEQKQKDKIIQIAAGGNHTLLLTETGSVYASGCNTDGRCGISPQNLNDQHDQDQDQDQARTQTHEYNTNINTFQRVILTDSTGTTVDKFKCIAATWEGSILVSEIETNNEMKPDKVFVHGSSTKGELGHNSTTLSPGTSLPNFPPQNTSIRSITASMNHAVVVLSNGTVYGWGASRKGQLGQNLKSEKIIFTPSEIEVPFLATQAVSGREFTFIVGDKSKGEIVVLGDQLNRWGICDVADEKRLRERIRIRIRERERQAQTQVEERDREQEQEQGNESGNEKSGIQLEARATLASVDSGISSHSHASTSATSPTASTMWGFEDIGASWHGIYVLVRAGTGTRAQLDNPNPKSESESDKNEDGIIVSWGRNDRGQLPDSTLPSVQRLAVGSEHALVLLADGSVAAFGWGEHGNCGPDTDNRGNVSGFKVISLDASLNGNGRVVGVGAGCATSWVIVD
ncbi:hypothetical protein N7456_011124 [Penicillium angulare]|uniref:Regulator of chromosome condensation, RCC1 n=1 Tax=Penicillium angulare TaxID=116970 RepID=A0A9W9JZK8_9EURO|nr:hypothetical protein N7456_011124 [Penicillium angulare]